MSKLATYLKVLGTLMIIGAVVVLIIGVNQVSVLPSSMRGILLIYFGSAALLFFFGIWTVVVGAAVAQDAVKFERMCKTKVVANQTTNEVKQTSTNSYYQPYKKPAESTTIVETDASIVEYVKNHCPDFYEACVQFYSGNDFNKAIIQKYNEIKGK